MKPQPMFATDRTAARLPEWAARQEPLNMDQAARVLGVSRRTLTTILKTHPHYELRGRGKRVFYPEHVQKLRRARWDSKSNLDLMESGALAAPSQEGAYERALKRATSGRRNSQRRPSSGSSGKVLPMERPKQ